MADTSSSIFECAIIDGMLFDEFTRDHLSTSFPFKIQHKYTCQVASQLLLF